MREAWERNNPGVPYPGDLEDNVGIQESLPDNNNQNQENEKETK
jgi:hypothetical protein